VEMYWWKQCPNCRGGRLALCEDTTNMRMYLHCEECETGFLDPEEVNEPGAGFLTVDCPFESHAADIQTIRKYSWERFALHFVSE
jgi:hypothetical protein